MSVTVACAGEEERRPRGEYREVVIDLRGKKNREIWDLYCGSISVGQCDGGEGEEVTCAKCYGFILNKEYSKSCTAAKNE